MTRIGLVCIAGDHDHVRFALVCGCGNYAESPDPEITDTVNNGVNEFIFVLKQGNYLLPPRAQRSFPLLPGRQGVLS